MSPLRLTGSTSGYSQIDAPAVAGDQTFTLPGTGGTLDRLNRAGNILQVVQGIKTDRASATGYVWTSTGISVNITPSSASNNILIFSHIHVGGSNMYDCKLRLVRDGVAISGALGDGTGSRPQVTSVVNGYDNLSEDTHNIIPTTISYYDQAVSTTSQVTYSIEMAAYSTYVVYINRSSYFAATAQYDSTPISTIIAMEVAA